MTETHIIDTNLQLVARRVPDFSIENDGAGGKTAVELPGLVEIGVEIGGRFVVLESLKAGLFDESVQQSRPQSDGTSSTGEQTQTGEQSQTGDTPPPAYQQG